jgi:hypothetical protein
MQYEFWLIQSFGTASNLVVSFEETGVESETSHEQVQKYGYFKNFPLGKIALVI